MSEEEAINLLIDYVEDIHKDNTVIYCSMPKEIKEAINVLRPKVNIIEDNEKTLFDDIDL